MTSRWRDRRIPTQVGDGPKLHSWEYLVMPNVWRCRICGIDVPEKPLIELGCHG